MPKISYEKTGEKLSFEWKLQNSLKDVLMAEATFLHLRANKANFTLFKEEREEMEFMTELNKIVANSKEHSLGHYLKMKSIKEWQISGLCLIIISS